MRIRSSRKLANYLYNLAKYRNLKIKIGSYVTKRSTLSQNVSIEYGCYIRESNIGEEVIILNSSLVSNSFINHNALISVNCEITHSKIESYSYFSKNCTVSYTSVGKFCSIGPGLISGIGDHPVNLMSTSPIFYSTIKQCGLSFSDQDLFSEMNPVKIGNDVWIGTGVFIRNGVNIGNGAVIGAGAIVIDDVPDYAVVVGTPAKVKRYRFQRNVIEKLLEIKWWEWGKNALIQMQPYIAQEDPDVFFKEAEKFWNKE